MNEIEDNKPAGTAPDQKPQPQYKHGDTVDIKELRQLTDERKSIRIYDTLLLDANENFLLRLSSEQLEALVDNAQAVTDILETIATGKPYGIIANVADKIIRNVQHSELRIYQF